jgi:DsbC/DsbD-like thiol-disulfide interchange protein
MRTKLVLTGVVLLAAAAAAIAQSRATAGPAPTGAAETPHLSVTTSTSAAAVPAGRRISLLLDVVLKPKMHVYAPEETAYLPVSLRIERSPAYTAGGPVFPKGEPFFFAPTGETQIVYSHPFRIEVPVTVATPPGGRRGSPVTIRGTLTYQACDDRVCYRPKDVSLAWTLRIP